jgi:uncharacterized protein with von Willebrand factor type A (vWA) domain
VNRDGRVRSLLFEQREERLAALALLPRSLWLGSLINSQGSLEPRLRSLQGLREALLAGAVPDPASECWPDPALAAGLHAILLELGLPGLCRDHDELTDQLLGSMLWHLDLIVDYVDRGDSTDAAIARALAAFAEDWQERRGLLDELEAVFGTTGNVLKNTRWDQLRGLLASDGWQEAVRIRRLLDALPALSDVLRRLGRTQPAADEDESHRLDLQLAEQSTAWCARIVVTHVPEMPGETRGVCRSGRIARMLPSETMQLTHRRLRLLWHAHHAERCLLTYEEDERMHQSVRDRVPVPRPCPQRKPNKRMEAGPMLICVDTSGSMQGGAEAVAKAVVLEAMRTAHAQHRHCHVFAYGGPDEIVEHELNLDAAGIEHLAQFLGQGFRGGTDICGPLERVLDRLLQERWQRADLLIASDGEFGATPRTALAVARAKAELGIRVQAVLIGDRETIGVLELADDVFWVRDWRRYGGYDVDSPVPTKSLTAIFFPGALRSAGGHMTSGGDATPQANPPPAAAGPT